MDTRTTTLGATRARANVRPPDVTVVIPALNEAAAIGSVVAAVPRRLEGVGRIDVVVVDDGSTDETAIRAYAAGADDVVRHARSRGLAAAFNSGVQHALARGANIVVHLDGDGQHDPRDIPRILAPLLTQSADIVVGVRPLSEAREMDAARRLGNRAGSWLFRRLLRITLSDFTSGYRAFSRDALLRLNIVSDYTYTLESLIQAARKRLAVAEVPVAVRPRTAGQSRMTRSLARYIGRTAGQAFRCLLHANPLAVFGRAAAAMMLLSIASTGWFLAGYQSGGLHLPALLAAVLASILSVGLLVSGLVADGINTNRRLLEDALYRIKSLERADVAEPESAEPFRLPFVAERVSRSA